MGGMSARLRSRPRSSHTRSWPMRAMPVMPSTRWWPPTAGKQLLASCAHADTERSPNALPARQTLHHRLRPPYQHCPDGRAVLSFHPVPSRKSDAEPGHGHRRTERVRSRSTAQHLFPPLRWPREPGQARERRAATEPISRRRRNQRRCPVRGASTCAVLAVPLPGGGEAQRTASRPYRRGIRGSGSRHQPESVRTICGQRGQGSSSLSRSRRTSIPAPVSAFTTSPIPCIHS